MRKVENILLFSPSDLTVFLKSQFASWMDRFRLEYRSEAPQPDEADAAQKLIQDLGIAHELEYLEILRAEGRDICEIVDGPNRFEHTLAALRDGREIIYQAWLRSSGDATQFAGAADFLVRTNRPSALGAHSYEPWDTKLALSPKPYFIIQLLCYAEMLEEIQGVFPQTIRLVAGDKSNLDFRTEDFVYFYRSLKERFIQFHNSFDRNTHPELVKSDDHGKWSGEAERIVVQTDHLAQVAHISSAQIRKLHKAGITTMTALAAASADARPVNLDKEIFDNLCLQARLQKESDGLEHPLFAVVNSASAPVAEADDDIQECARGLEALPPASQLDVYFDMEGYPFAAGGLEYLFGVVCDHCPTTEDDSQEPAFYDWWAHDSAEEKRAFEQFIDWAYDRWLSDPAMHIYHYGDYEVSAVKRLMSRYGTREEKVDDLLRNHVFVNLYRIVRQGLRVGEPAYSLKNIEHLYRGKRAGEVATAADSVVEYQRWLATKDGTTWKESAILKGIRDYNKEDCVSTWQLCTWLRSVQEGAAIKFRPHADRQAGPKATEQMEKRTRASDLAEQILSDGARASSPHPIAELLAHLLEFHRREMRPVMWFKYHRHEMTEEELIDDIDCLGGLTRVGDQAMPLRAERKNSPLCWRYSYNPDQDTKLTIGSKCFFAHDLRKRTSIVELDTERGEVVIRLPNNSPPPPERLSLIPDDWVSTTPLEDSIFRTVERWTVTGDLPPCLVNFLHRQPPSIEGLTSGPIIDENAGDLLEQQIRAICGLQNGTLCIQGPPGSGKTYLGAEAIVELISRGKRVGIASNSHAAVFNLMEAVMKAAVRRKVEVTAAKAADEFTRGHALFDFPGVHHVKPARDAFQDRKRSFTLIGGTAWDFCHPDACDELDYLFVDEAGQVSLANLVAMAPSAKNLVLLGDQMQLSQPLKGCHPGESGLSAIEYYLDGKATIPNEQGIFLGITRRLRPEICQFISDSVYESRLHCDEITHGRRLLPPSGSLLPATEGVVFVPCWHVGNVQGSDEEVEVIAKIYNELLRCQRTSTDHGTRRMTPNDILLVAPYNMQVRKLQSRLPQARVGSVDKFQGQEADVVILSMACSDANASSRGMEFIFSVNRLNVALSRAQILALVVGSPALVRTDCKSTDQMKLVNLFCKIAQTRDTSKEVPQLVMP